MAEILSVKAKEKQGTGYQDQPKPFLRNRDDKEIFRDIEKKNHHLVRALDEIKRAPPAIFHAPKGYESVKEGTQLQQQRQGKKKDDMPGKEHYVDVTAWPPNSANHHAITQARQQRQLDIDNARMQQKLEEIYDSSRVSVYGKNKELGGQTIKCSERWDQRTDIYQPLSKPSTSAKAQTRPNSSREGPQPLDNKVPKSQQRPNSAPRAAGVPKSMGVAMCGGCGVKAFRKANGPGLAPCIHCKKVFYCSETCMRTDFQSHKAMCQYYLKGIWAPFGKRPEEDYWVNNASMAEARRELRSRKDANHRMSPEEELEEQARVAQVVKKAKDREREALQQQAQIEYRANWGLDGPRPCMYSGGKKI